jgi:hypothetical protein
MRRIAILSLLVAVAIGWWALDTERRPERTRPVVEPPAAAPAELDGSDLVEAEVPAPEPTRSPFELDGQPAARGQRVAGATAPSPDLVVLVVDPSGAPVPGLTVHLAPLASDTSQVSGTTDPSGRIRLDGLRARLAEDGQRWHLWHEVCFRRPVPQLELTPERLQTEEVVSVQPWFGSIVIRVSEPDAVAAPDGTGVELTLLEEREPGEQDRPGLQWPAETRAGEARFPFVEPDLSWAARAWHLVADEGTTVTGPGPAVGREALFAVRLGLDHPVFRFRAVDEGGRAFANVELVLEDDGFLTTRGRVHTDGSGFFRIDGARGGPSRLRWLGRGAYLVRLELHGTEHLGRLEVPDDPGPGLVEAGDVVLAANPLLAAGRVVDEAGRPVERAEVAAGSHGFDENVFMEGPGFSTATDAEGRFELHGRLPEETFPIRARADGARSEDVNIREGRTDVLLVLHGRHGVSGQLVFDGDRLPEGLRGALRSEKGETTGWQHLDGDGSFGFPAVAAGTYDFWIALDDVPVVRRDGLVIREDLWLGEVDLRGYVEPLEVLLIGGSDTVKGRLSWRPSGGAASWQTRSFDGPRIPLSVPTGPVDLCIRPEGVRAAWLVGVRHRCEVVLREPLRVRLDLVTDGEIPAPPYVFDPVLEREGITVSHAVGPDSYREDVRSLLFEVGSAGPLRVTWHLERRGDSWAVGGGTLRGHELDIEVLDVPGEQLFELRLDVEALTRLKRHPPF